MRTLRKLGPALLAITILFLGFSRAASADDDPPGRVARLNYLRGTVSFLPAGGSDDDWVNAVPNRPMTIGDRVWADNESRAELHIGSTAIRMDQSTGVSFINLSDDTVQIQLSEGSLIIRVRRLDPNETFEVDTPNLAFSLLRPGVYRIDASADGNRTAVLVRQGQGAVTGGGRSFNVKSDQQAIFSGTDNLEYDLVDADAQPLSEFDTWASDRDRREDSSSSARYVSSDTTGYEDLDTYGTWTDAPEYGHVWVPTGVAVGWAPYRFGHWVWIMPWGWTWVDEEPWGFAPFHYGRWAFWGARWVWVPGPMGPRPCYAPALVAWVGGGPGFSFSVSFGGGGGVAWFPLGPREVFVPSYHVTNVYVTRVNITNTVVDRTTVINTYNNVNVRNVTYVNQRVNGGVTAVPHEVFVKGQAVARNNVQLPQREVMNAPVTRQIQEAPQKESIVGSARPAVVRPPASMLTRPVVATPNAIQKLPPQRQQSGQSPVNLRPSDQPNPGNRGNDRNPSNPIGRDQPPPPVRGNLPVQQPVQPVNPKGKDQPPPPPARDNFPPQQPVQPVNPKGKDQPPPPPARDNFPPQQPVQPVNPKGKDQPRHLRPHNFPPQQPVQPVNPKGKDQPPPPPARDNFPPQQQIPVVRPAPPIRPPTPQERDNEVSKQKSWEDAHPRPPVRQLPPPPPPPAQSKQAPPPAQSKQAPPPKDGKQPPPKKPGGGPDH